MDRCKLQSGHRVLIWGAAGGLGVFATQLCALAGADAVGVVSSDEKGELIEQLGAVGHINRREYNGHDAPGGETAEEEKARFKESRRFCKAVEENLGGPPDIVFEHVGKATFPTSVLCVKPFGKVVICGATSGYQLDFDVRYLWMRQKEIIGSHFANAWEATKANELIEESKIRPVLWQTMGFESVAEAHQLLRDNRHLGKIAILVGATEEGQGKTAEGPGAIRAEVGSRRHGGVVWVPWYSTVFRKDAFAGEVARVAPLALRYGATQYAVHVDNDDRYRITQMTWFESKTDWYRYWDGPGDDRVPGAQHRAATRSRSATRGPTRSPPARSVPRSATASPRRPPSPQPTPEAAVACGLAG